MMEHWWKMMGTWWEMRELMANDAELKVNVRGNLPELKQNRRNMQFLMELETYKNMVCWSLCTYWIASLWGPWATINWWMTMARTNVTLHFPQEFVWHWGSPKPVPVVDEHFPKENSHFAGTRWYELSPPIFDKPNWIVLAILVLYYTFQCAPHYIHNHTMFNMCNSM